mgnify:CR=1 FL=1
MEASTFFPTENAAVRVSASTSFGVVGSTDSHTGLATTEEDNFFGKVTLVEPTDDPVRFEEAITGRFTPDDPSDDQVHGQGLAAGLAALLDCGLAVDVTAIEAAGDGRLEELLDRGDTWTVGGDQSERATA